MVLHDRHKLIHVSTHQIELVSNAILGRMHRNLGRRQSEDEPPSPDVDVREFQNIFQESAIRFRIRAVDQ